ncbi:MAG TPA: glycosyltransferase family 4 protein [Thermoleophilaceae bacterium]
MRVVHLANYGGPYAGSFIPMIAAAGRAAREAGWQVTIAFTQGARDRAWLRELAADDLEVVFAPPGGQGAKAGWIGELLGGRDEPAILHTHFTTFDLPALRAARGRRRTAVVWHVHTTLRPERAMRLRNAVKLGLVGRRAHAIVCVGEAIAEQVLERYAPRGRVTVLPNAIDLRRFPPIDADRRRAARGALGLEDGTPAVLHFGWDWRVKGGDLLAAAVERAARGGPIVALTVGGDDPARAARERVGLDAGVLRVVKPTDDVASLYAAADAFAATSRGEAFSFAVAEALASGLPVVATDIPAHAALAREVGNVRLVPGEPDAVAAALREALEREPGAAREQAVRARERVAERFGTERWTRELIELYGRILP